ncbi:MAG: OmpA family protein [Acidobacteriota bacterium]
MKSVYAVAIVALAAAGAPACATKKFVRTEVGQVNDKIATLSESLEGTQERVRQNEEKIGDVDRRAQQSAADAQKAAQAADARAGQVGATLGARADAIEASARKLLFEVVLSENQGNFRFGAAELPDAARSAIDDVVSRLKAHPASAWVEIEGHTDSVGDAAYNERLGQARAESVKRYLYEQHQIPLHKMNVISYGETRPVAPNTTRDGRAQNRRVVIRVLG